MSTLRFLTVSYCLVAATTLLVPPLVFAFSRDTLFGQDAAVFYAVTQAVLHGEADVIYDPLRLTALTNRLVNLWFAPGFSGFAFKTWLYPPPALLFIVPLGLIPPTWFYPVLEVITGIVVATATAWRRGIGGIGQAAAILISPAALVNVMDGQNAFLSLALFIGGMRLLDENPILAGALLGALSYKPQVFLLIPFALIGASAWRALGSVALSAALLAVLSGILFGIEPWRLWLHLTLEPPPYFFPLWLEYGMETGLSLLVCALLLGAPFVLAATLQCIVTFATIIGVIYVFRRSRDWEMRAAAILCGATLATPHLQSYDAIFAAAAITFWYRLRFIEGFRKGELSLLAVVWVASAFTPDHFVIGFAVPVGLMALGVLIMKRAAQFNSTSIAGGTGSSMPGRAPS